ncbi:chaperonin CPN60-2, mitochondrial [Olea europaea subsp. europaea]|uniref:Chaperonin CPN60-2, mitochondrial n=1 Tax=Olea europaea subsp. europaea TaxID=158383 RepID=A0A8S0T381_OLEEU|nr:chaperonin CPN60-2, mitochondrial [Olea europaea subsp. europaea]
MIVYWMTLSPSKDSTGLYSVAKSIQLKEKVKKQDASSTNDAVGDGTTCAIVLTRAIFTEGSKSIGTCMNSKDLRRGISKDLRRGNPNMVMALAENKADLEDKEEGDC